MHENTIETHGFDHEPHEILNLDIDYEPGDEESDEDIRDEEPSYEEIKSSLVRMLQCPDEFQDFDEAYLTLARVLSITPEGDFSVSLIYEMYDNLCKKHASQPQETVPQASPPLVVQSGDDDQNLDRLHELGTFFRDQYYRENQLPHLQKSIACMKKAVGLSNDSDPDLPQRLADLGNSLFHRFERLDDSKDLEDALEYQRRAVSLTFDMQPQLLSDLGYSLMRRFQLLGHLDDLEDAISCQEKAILNAARDVDTTPWVAALGDSLVCRFEHTSDLASLDRAIELVEGLLQFDLGDRWSTIYNNLGSALQKRFMYAKDLEGITRAIECQKAAVSLTSDRHYNKPMFLNNLGDSLQLRFEYLGESNDIDLAISHQEQALHLLSSRHALRPSILDSLGNSLRWRFESAGKLDDINRAIAYLLDALELTPADHSLSLRLRLLDSLGNALRQRFETQGELSDIDKAITAHHEAVSGSTQGHMNQADRLNHLGNTYMTRYERLDEISDLDNAIKYHRAAVSLNTQGDTKAVSLLADLGGTLLARFQNSGDLSHLDEAIICQRKSIALSPIGASAIPALLGNLSSSLQSRYRHTSQVDDINECISCLEKAIDLTQDRHPDKPLWLNNLCSSLQLRFKHARNIDDINKAIEFQTKAVHLTPDYHVYRAEFLVTLARCMVIRASTVSGQLADLDAIIDTYRQAASATSGKPSTRFQAAYKWAKVAKINTISPLEAYKAAFEIIPQIAWLGVSINRRYQEISSIGGFVTDAVANAISEHEYNLALEWLEEGRSIVWRQMLQLRTPMDELRSVNPSMADRLEEIAKALDQAGTSSSKSKKSIATILETDMSLEHAAQTHRQLAKDWSSLVDQVRQLSGFSDFLRPKKASELIKAARDGPVVAINVQKERCDALVLSPGATQVSCVPLRGLTFEKAADAQKHLIRSLRLAGVRFRTERRPERKPALPLEDQLEDVLEFLWNDVVQPILDYLGFIHRSAEVEIPHLTWCATGPLAFLPLHAAGCYGQLQARVRIFNYVVSSYTPTIGGLIQTSPAATINNFSGILAIGQASTPGQSSLPGTVKELDCIIRHAGQLPVTRLIDQAATTDAVINAINSHSWVHFACHASQDTSDPTASAFFLHKGTLDLATITKQPLRRKAFAFLSACQTATGDDNLPEEAIHLAAGMIMAGYPTVVATMWSIKDNDAPLIAEYTYSEMLSEGKADSKKASRALHHAVSKLRDKVGEKAFESWVPYIHIGI